MRRYIDAYKIPRHGKRGGECYWQEIEQLPTADVIEVVRCKDCKYFDKDENASESWCECVAHFGKYFAVDENDFCSYGERAEA